MCMAGKGCAWKKASRYKVHVVLKKQELGKSSAQRGDGARWAGLHPQQRGPNA